MKIIEVEFDADDLEIILYCQYPDQIIEFKYVDKDELLKIFIDILNALTFI